MLTTNPSSALIAGAVLFVVVSAILNVLFQLELLVAAIVGFVLGAAVTMVLIARSRGEKAADVAREVIQEAVQPAQNSIERQVEERLMALNLRLRLDTMELAVIEKSEVLIDRLMDIVPKVLQHAPGSEVSFDLEKLSTDYFPDLIDKYLDLGADDQQQQKQHLLNQIDDMIELVKQAEDSINKGRLNEFKVIRNFIQAKGY